MVPAHWHLDDGPPTMPRMLANIPLNLITGFLGAGKTTLVRHLLVRRPAGARWAVLVNEFGELGIDGAFLDASGSQDGVVVKEIPGGCLCCANGVPFRIALNLLLKQARPDRVLIETTGLGHPLSLLEQLATPEYRGVLLPRATVCVVDPVALRDDRVRTSEVFLGQLASADLLVVNHVDRVTGADLSMLDALVAARGLNDLQQVRVVRGAMDDPALLDLPRRPRGWRLLPPAADSGMHHAGAVWPADTVFPHDDTLSLLFALPVRRLKAVLHTDAGWLEINATPAVSEWTARAPADDSRVEVIVERDVGLPDLKSVLDTLLARP